MDQKRILWIVAASGIFLLVVVGVAMFLSAPQIQTQQTLASLQGTGNTWIKGEVKNPENHLPLSGFFCIIGIATYSCIPIIQKNKIQLSVRNFPPMAKTHMDKQSVNATSASWGERRSRFVL